MNSSEDDPLNHIIHNCHTHLFNLYHVPKYYKGKLFPVTLIKNERIAALLYKLINKRLNQYAAFFYAAMKRSSEDIFNELKGYYPGKTKFVALSIDFDFMGAGKCLKPFLIQIEELRILRDKFPENIFPFIGIDPRRDHLLDLVKKYIEDYNFTGLKLYPSVGFFPDDPKLFPIYEYAEKNEIPITVHCIPKNRNHFRGKITKEWKEKVRPVPGFNSKETRKKYDFAMYFSHPYWYEQILHTFNNLKINLAHFGGSDEWNKYLDMPANDEKQISWYKMIRRLIENPKYKHVYSDISFTVYNRNLYPLLKNLLKNDTTRNHILFGSDFYMLQKDYRERRFGLDVRGYLDDEDYWRIAEINPRRFLSSKFHRF